MYMVDPSNNHPQYYHRWDEHTHYWQIYPDLQLRHGKHICIP